MAVLFIRVDTRDLLDIEDITAMRTYKLGRIQRMFEVAHGTIFQEGTLVRVDLDIVVGGFEEMDVFERDDLDLTTCLDDDAVLLSRGLGRGFEQGFGAACRWAGFGVCVMGPGKVAG